MLNNFRMQISILDKQLELSSVNMRNSFLTLSPND